MSFKIPVEAGQIMILARSLGDNNPAYRDPESPEAKAVGGIIAPPIFTELRYHYDQEAVCRARFDKPWYGSGRELTGTPGYHPHVVDYPGIKDGQVMMPGEITFEYIEPIRVGDTITMTETIGDTWEKNTAAAGTLTFFAVTREYRNQHGVVAVIERLTFLIMDKVEGFQ